MLSDTSCTNDQMKDELKALNDVISRDALRYKKRIAHLCTDNENLLDNFSTLKRSAEQMLRQKEELVKENKWNQSRIKILEEIEERLTDERTQLEVVAVVVELRNKLHILVGKTEFL